MPGRRAGHGTPAGANDTRFLLRVLARKLFREIFDHSFVIGFVLQQLKQPKWRTAAGKNIHAPVRVLLHLLDDFRRASNRRHILARGVNHPEFELLHDAAPDHLLVSRLKNMQGKGSARQQHHIKREKRDPSRSHNAPRSTTKLA